MQAVGTNIRVAPINPPTETASGLALVETKQIPATIFAKLVDDIPEIGPAGTEVLLIYSELTKFRVDGEDHHTVDIKAILAVSED